MRLLFLAMVTVLGCATLNEDATFWQKFVGNGGPYEVSVSKRTPAPVIAKSHGSLKITNSTSSDMLFDIDCTYSPRVRKYLIPSLSDKRAGEMQFMGDKLDLSCKVDYYDADLYKIEHPEFDPKRVWADPYAGDK